jgi:hypothetical protein
MQIYEHSNHKVLPARVGGRPVIGIGSGHATDSNFLHFTTSSVD